MIVHSIRKRGLFSDQVVLLADSKESCKMETMLDTRTYSTKQGKKYLLKLPKGWSLDVGDYVSFGKILSQIGLVKSNFTFYWD